MGSKKNFVIDEVECLKMVTIFEFMKRKKWLKPYNAPKFRSAYDSVYPREYRKIVKRMGKKKRKSQMFLLYRKYYHFFIDDKQYQYWLQKRDAKEKKSMKGTVKFYNKTKKWGFITGEDGADYFVHYTSICTGYKTLLDGDIVNFEIGTGANERTQAVNVTPVLTLAMVTHELSKEGLHLMRIGDDKGVHGWYVVDKSDNPVIDKEMSLLEVAAYVGFDVEGLTER